VIISPFRSPLLEWLAAPVTQACHYVAYPHTTADSTSADNVAASPLCAGFRRPARRALTRSCGRVRKAPGTKSRCVGTRRTTYGILGGSCVPVRFDGSGADDRLGQKNCGIDFEPPPCALRERIGVGCGPVWRDDASGSAAGESDQNGGGRCGGGSMVRIMRCRS